jgi:tetratricopeptide (TPR) repeat protein
MRPLELPDIHYYTAACGWLELGNPAEALAELNQITDSHHPDVLELRWRLLSELKRWDEALHVARSLLKAAPERPTGWVHQAYSLRRITDGSVGRAMEALLPAVPKFPEEEIIPYNLSCYSCQLQNLDAARAWLQRACEIGGREPIKARALADEDLRPLWEEIKKL